MQSFLSRLLRMFTRRAEFPETSSAGPPLEAVLCRIRCIFPDRPENDVLAQLEAYGTEDYERERHRVYLAILKLCDEEGLDDPAVYIKTAKEDYRDVLYWAEYPNQARNPRKLSEIEAEEFGRLDREQYETWLRKGSE